MSNIFTLIKEPEENPSNLLDSYRQQNIIMQKMRMLHTAFDGIKLNHWNDTDRELPDILAGSICEFEGRLFETNQTIKLYDNINSGSGVLKEDLRFIKLVIHRDNKDSNNDYLTAEIAGGYSETVSDGFPSYDYENRGFYVKDENNIITEKYLRLSMKYDSDLGGYVEKKYFNINDFQRKGLTLKRKTVTFEAGEHEFDFPDDVNSITIHITSGGGGAGFNISASVNNGYHNATDGGTSKVLINDNAITTCTGGGGGKISGLSILGIAGKASGQGKLYQGANGNNGIPGQGGILESQCLASGGNGGNGIVHNIGNQYSIGGGSGSAATVDINRDMLGASSKIKIIVGSGGVSGYMDGNATRMNNGENGSAVIEYMQK